MQLRRIAMVEPANPTHNVYSFVRLPRLGLPILGTLARQMGFEVRIHIEQALPLDWAELTGADLVCISTITPTAPAAYRLADSLRAAGVAVLLGGPHVTFAAEEALAHADWVLRGEGERSLPRLLAVLRDDGDPAAVPGLSWRDGEAMRHNSLDATPVDMERDVPIPDFSLVAGGRRAAFPRGVLPLQTSRGCPHHCAFCSVTPMFGRHMRFASADKVAATLDGLRGQGDQVFFYDDNFCAPPARAKALLDELLTRGTFMPEPLAQVSVRAARDPELLALMQRAGFYSVFVGFESINADALALYKKRQAVDDIRLAIERFHAHGIRVHGMFVSGSDAEGVDTIRATARFARQQGIDSMQFLILTPLPGTPLFDQLEREGRLLTRDWSLYDTHHAVFRPARMSARTLMAETFGAMRRFYGYGRSLGYALRGELRTAGIGVYARGQVRRWFRENRSLLAEPRWQLGGLEPQATARP